MVAQFCEYAKTAEIVHFKRVNFICELYLYKAVTFLNVYSIPQWFQQFEYDKGTERSIKYFDYQSIVEWAFAIKGTLLSSSRKPKSC